MLRAMQVRNPHENDGFWTENDGFYRVTASLAGRTGATFDCFSTVFRLFFDCFCSE